MILQKVHTDGIGDYIGLTDLPHREIDRDRVGDRLDGVPDTRRMVHDVAFVEHDSRGLLPQPCLVVLFADFNTVEALDYLGLRL